MQFETLYEMYLAVIRKISKGISWYTDVIASEELRNMEVINSITMLQVIAHTFWDLMLKRKSKSMSFMYISAVHRRASYFPC